MTTALRIKFICTRVEPTQDGERLHFNAVAADDLATKQAGCIVDVTATELLGSIVPGVHYFAEFTPAE